MRRGDVLQVAYGWLIATRINGAIWAVVRQVMVWDIPIGRALSMPTSFKVDENLQVAHTTTLASLHAVV
jgi:hypothetical protein